MADYFAHCLKLGSKEGAELPRVFYVNWFRKDEDGRFLWPGYGENSRVLEWIFRRCEGTADAVETPIGMLPAEGSINTEGLNIDDEAMAELLSVDTELFKGQLPQVEAHLAQFGDRLPDEITAQLRTLEERLG
jgi:phosphoenolpyruvate carboxykinase (GTP)